MKDPRDSDLSHHHKQFFEEVYPNPCSSKGQKAAPIGLFRKLHVSTSYSGFDCPANRNNNKSLQLNNPSRNPSHVSGFAGSGSFGSFGSFGRFLWLPSCFVTRCSSARSASCLSCGACQAGQKIRTRLPCKSTIDAGKSAFRCGKPCFEPALSHGPFRCPTPSRCLHLPLVLGSQADPRPGRDVNRQDPS